MTSLINQFLYHISINQIANKTIKLNLNKNNTYKIFLDYCVYKYTVSSEILTIIKDICQIFAFILRPMQTYKGVSYLVRFYMISPQFYSFFLQHN